MHASAHHLQPFVAWENPTKYSKFVASIAVLCSGIKIETQRCDEVLADADKKLSQLGSELAQAKYAHEQALLRQQEHASQTERQLEVPTHYQLMGFLTRRDHHACMPKRLPLPARSLTNAAIAAHHLAMLFEPAQVVQMHCAGVVTWLAA